MNRDAWLILGATAERLGNPPLSKDADVKYLALSPLFQTSMQEELGSQMKSALDVAIKNLAGNVVKGANTGAEIRLGIKFLFGATPPEED